MGATVRTSDCRKPAWLELQGSGRLRRSGQLSWTRSDRDPLRMYAFILYAGAQIPRMTLETPDPLCHLGFPAILTSLFQISQEPYSKALPNWESFPGLESLLGLPPWQGN